MRHVIKKKIVCLCVSRNFKRNKIHDGLFGYIYAEYHKTSSLFDLNFGVSCCDLHSAGSLT
jgi:NADH:ubiquinone oxidoreductase subunit B-like Fe-S oxidoreductase